jgi:hypothetical protein
MSFLEWQKEFVRLLVERIPEFNEESARGIAESSEESYSEGLTPEEGLDAEMECWTNDDEE